MDEVATRADVHRGLSTASLAGDAVLPDPAIVDPAEHNVVFTSLVTGDNDIIGLVAYSIYKQNKYDWLQAYSTMHGRMPNAEEAQAYLLGESTKRRLATYRHLAEAVLEGRGPDLNETTRVGDGARVARLRRDEKERRGEGRQGGSDFQLPTPVIVALGVALVALLLLFYLLHSGAPLPPGAAAH